MAANRFLEGVVKDDEDRLGRSSLGHFEMFIPDRLELAVYPVRLAHEKLIYQGQQILPIMLAKMQDPGMPERLRIAAAEVAVAFQDESVLPALIKAGEAGLLPPYRIGRCFQRHVGFEWCPRGTPLSECDRIEFVLSRLKRAQDLGRHQFALQELDRLMEAIAEDGGLQSGVCDLAILQWLDRVYDRDLSEYLRTNAPSAYEFRMRQLARGYDPAVSFDAGMQYYMSDFGFRVFEDPKDQAGCLQLLNVLYGISQPGRLEEPREWMENLRSWYRRNRAKFRYDASVHRLILQEPTGPSASKPS